MADVIGFRRSRSYPPAALSSDSQPRGRVMQFSSAATLKERLGSDICKRVRMDLAAISPADRRLAEALQYWNGLRKGKRLPARPEIDLFSLKPLMGWMHVVDTSAGSPEAYYYRLWGSRVGLDSGKDHTRMPLGEIPWPLLRNAAITDYADVAPPVASQQGSGVIRVERGVERRRRRRESGAVPMPIYLPRRQRRRPPCNCVSSGWRIGRKDVSAWAGHLAALRVDRSQRQARHDKAELH